MKMSIMGGSIWFSPIFQVRLFIFLLILIDIDDNLNQFCHFIVIFFTKFNHTPYPAEHAVGEHICKWLNSQNSYVFIDCYLHLQKNTHKTEY